MQKHLDEAKVTVKPYSDLLSAIKLLAGTAAEGNADAKTQAAAKTASKIWIDPGKVTHLASYLQHSRKSLDRLNIALVVLSLHVCFTDVMKSSPTRKN